jgi:hypothetical protein
MTITPDHVDVRGPRFAAWVTTAVLVVTLLSAAVDETAAAIVLAVQAAVFAVGAIRGPRGHPYGVLFGRVIAPRLGRATDTEPVPPLKFAQVVGLVFAVLGVAGFALGLPPLGLTATALALFAAFLNAAFGICLGCQLYPLVQRLRRIPAHS